MKKYPKRMTEMKKMKKSDLIFLIVCACIVIVLCPLLIFRNRIFNNEKPVEEPIVNEPLVSANTSDDSGWYEALEKNYHYNENNTVVDYTQMTPPEIIAFELSVRYNLDFTVDDVKIWNMDRVDGYPVYQAEVYSKEHDAVFYAFYYTGTIKVTDDYARFTFGDRVNEAMNNVFDNIEFGEELNQHYVAYGLTSIVYDDNEYEDYIKETDTFISTRIKYEAGKEFSAEDIQKIKDLCSGLENENLYYSIHIYIGDQIYNIFHDRNINTPYEEQMKEIKEFNI